MIQDANVGMMNNKLTKIKKFINEWLWDTKTFVEYMTVGFVAMFCAIPYVAYVHYYNESTLVFWITVFVTIVLCIVIVPRVKRILFKDKEEKT